MRGARKRTHSRADPRASSTSQAPPRVLHVPPGVSGGGEDRAEHSAASTLQATPAETPSLGVPVTAWSRHEAGQKEGHSSLQALQDRTAGTRQPLMSLSGRRSRVQDTPLEEGPGRMGTRHRGRGTDPVPMVRRSLPGTAPSRLVTAQVTARVGTWPCGPAVTSLAYNLDATPVQK